MDIYLLIAGFLFTLVGIAGFFLSVLSGLVMGWVTFTSSYKRVTHKHTFLGITSAVIVLFYTFGYNTNKYNTNE